MKKLEKPKTSIKGSGQKSIRKKEGLISIPTGNGKHAMNHKEKTRKRLTDESIVSSLIACGSIKESAEQLGCTERTIYERKKKADFQKLYSQARAEILKTATAKLQGNMITAIETLEELMRDPETARQTRANCAVSILQYGVRFTEAVDILERIDALEQNTKEVE